MEKAIGGVHVLMIRSGVMRVEERGECERVTNDEQGTRMLEVKKSKLEIRNL